MTENEKNKIRLIILEEIDGLFSGSEKCITQPDDPSGLFSEWVLDTEAFRNKLQKRIESLQQEAMQNE